MIFHIHQIDAVPARAEAMRGNLKQRADGARCRWHGGHPLLSFRHLFEKGKREKKRTLSTTILEQKAHQSLPVSAGLSLLSLNAYTHTHDNTNIDRFSTAVDRSCHPAPPIARTFFSFSLFSTILACYFINVPSDQLFGCFRIETKFLFFKGKKNKRK